MSEAVERATTEESDERVTSDDPTVPEDAAAAPKRGQRAEWLPGDETASGSTLSLRGRVRGASRWSVWLVAGFFLLSLGLFYADPAVVAAAAIPFVYVGYAALSTLPDELSVDVRRQVEDRRLTPGDPVEVTVSVTNTGDSVLSDLRIVDGVPAELAVTAGSPRAAVSLRPGATAEFSYTVVVKRGDFAFGDARLLARSLLGTDAAALSATVEGADSVDCTDPAAIAGLDRATRRRTGVTASDRAGEGLEFHSTREYRAGDARTRVNWRQYAKSGDLVTTEFRQERAAREVVLLDVRPPTRRSAAPTHPTGAEYAAYAAEAAVERYRSRGHRVSLAVLGVDETDVDVPVRTAGDALWIENAGQDTGRRAADAVFGAAATVAADRSSPDGSWQRSLTETGSGEPRDRAVAALVAQFPDRAELLLVSPLVDTAPLAYAERAAVAGCTPTLLSPDPTGEATAGGRFAGAKRRVRLREARGVCDRVINWPADRSLSTVAAAVDGGGGR
jgi:uncharacterized repeat protein (TIGR01451 family)